MQKTSYRNHRFFHLGATAIVALMLLTGCNSQEGAQDTGPRKARVVQPQSASVNRYLYETGVSEAVNSVDLIARVSGFLEAVDYKEGREVKKGQRLFLIEQDQYRSQVKQSEASVLQARAALDNAQRQFDRQNKLSKASVTSESKLDDARATLENAKAELSSAEAALDQARLNLDYTTVSAPFDGFVTAHQVDVGALVTANSTTLATIVQMDPIHVSFSVSDRDVLELRDRARQNGRTLKDLGTIPVEVATSADGGYPIKGHLDYIAPRTATETGTLSARAVFDNRSRDLLPGLFVRIRIPIEKDEDALLVPPSAIGTDQQGRYVLVAQDDNTLERRPVTVLDKYQGLQQVEGELSSDDWLLMNAMSGPKDGDEIEREEVDARESHTIDQSAQDATDN